MSYEQLCVADRIVPLELLMRAYANYEATQCLDVKDI